MPTRFLINQCQIITFLILKSDIIENSGMELREIEGKYGCINQGGGGEEHSVCVCWPPSQVIGGPVPPPPLPTPMQLLSLN